VARHTALLASCSPSRLHHANGKSFPEIALIDFRCLLPTKVRITFSHDNALAFPGRVGTKTSPCLPSLLVVQRLVFLVRLFLFVVISAIAAVVIGFVEARVFEAMRLLSNRSCNKPVCLAAKKNDVVMEPATGDSHS
jgi:hypothetical protein